MTGGGLWNLRRKEVGEAQGFLIYTLLEMIGMDFIVFVEAYGVDYGMFGLFPEFAGGFPSVQQSSNK